MDKQHLKSLISQLEQEKRAHDQKFADNPEHNDCQPRFDTAISKLKEELAHHASDSCEAEPETAVRGDELKPAEKLNEVAQKLEEKAHRIKKKATSIVAKELNEMDGFPR